MFIRQAPDGADAHEVATMLYEFLKANRTELINRCRAKAAKRSPHTIPAVTEYGIPQLLSQIIETLRVEQTPEALARRAASGHRKPSLVLVPPDIAGTAAKHGDELRRQGIPIDQVVHGYGDLCQAVTELAMERDSPISVDEFHTFNRCLDDAIADAVTAYSKDVGIPIAKSEVESDGALALAHNTIQVAILSFAAMKGGSVGMSGPTAALHEKSLAELSQLINRALADPSANLSDVRAIISPAAPR